MKFFDLNENENSPLTDAIFEYQNTLNRGNYRALSSYEQEDWDVYEESDFVLKNLELLLLKLEPHEVSSISTKLKEEKFIGLSQIVHLLVSLTIMKKFKEMNPQFDNNFLDTIGASVCVEAGMPGPSLIYLMFLNKNLNIDTKVKLLLIEGMINKIFANKENFGNVSYIALEILINYWLGIVKANPKLELNFAIRASKYEKINTEIPKINKNDLTTIENFIILSLIDLGFNINKVNLKEFYSLSPKLISQSEESLDSQNSINFFN